MRLKIRYEQEFQTIELDAEATEELWVSLSLEGEGLTQEEKETLIQDTWEERFNRPDYNSWHKFDRHRGRSKAQPGKDDAEDEVDTNEPLMEEVADDLVDRQQRGGDVVDENHAQHDQQQPRESAESDAFE